MVVKTSKVVLERICKAGKGVVVLYKDDDSGQQGATVREERDIQPQ